VDPDPGSPKTYGSGGSGFGSATLTGIVQNSKVHRTKEFFHDLRQSYPASIESLITF
jgi:hypothetical protein